MYWSNTFYRRFEWNDIYVTHVFFTTYSLVYKEFKQKSLVVLPRLLALCFVLIVISGTLTFYGVRFQLSNPIQTFFNMLTLLCGLSMLLSFLTWLRITLQRNREKNIHSFSADECACIAYIVSTIMYAMSGPLFHIVNKDFVWSTRKESTLIYYMVTHFLYIVTVTGKILSYLDIQ